MPTMQLDDTRLHYVDEGTGPETIVFAHGLLWSHRMWLPQMTALRSQYRCIAYDHRGQGQSEVPPGDAIPIETVTHDAIAFIERLGVAPCHFVGLSMGGFVGMRVAARRPDLVASLCLLETAADAEPRANAPKYAMLNLIARTLGIAPLDRAVAPIMLGDSTLADPERSAACREELMRNDKHIYKAVNGVIRRSGFQHALYRIRAPTMVLWSQEDRAISRPRAWALHRGIPGSTWVELPEGGHSAPREQPAAVTQALQAFLAAHPIAPVAGPT